MVLTCVTPPAIEPITIEQAQGQLRITDLSDESDTINLFIQAIRERAEALTRRALITQQWELVLDRFPSGRSEITLPKGKLQTVNSIKYIDVNGTEQTLPSSTYRAITDCEPADVIPTYGLSWPTALNDRATVRIRFTCGYGPLVEDGPDNVPNSIKQWMLMNVSNLYENRESVLVGNRLTTVELITLADGLIENHRFPRL